jgi:hypothetical protein
LEGGRFRLVPPEGGFFLRLLGFAALLAALRLGILPALLVLMVLVRQSFLNLFKSLGPYVPAPKPKAPAATTHKVGATRDSRFRKSILVISCHLRQEENDWLRSKMQQ